MEWISLVMFAAVVIVLLTGFQVAFCLGGVALIFALGGIIGGVFDAAFLGLMPNRLFGSIMTNQTLLAVPLFVFMGVTLERARIAENLLDNLSTLFGSLRGGLGISVTLVGMLLAASTGIVGATVVTMGLLSLPTMLRRGYSPRIASGTICAAGTLGQIIPPSIVLVLLGDVLSSAYSQAQLAQNNFNPDAVSVGDLFAGALIPGLLLVGLYIAYLIVVAVIKPEAMPAAPRDTQKTDWISLLGALAPPLLLILAVLGSIIGGFATPTEAASVGAVGALLLASIRRALDLTRLREIMQSTIRISSMVFLILIGASLFSLVFRGYGGDSLVREVLTNLPGGTFGAVLCVMLLMFLLGFVLDFIEITFVIVPIVGPILLTMGIDPVWLGVMIAINLQTSFLTPPFGFALFYLRGVAPESLATGDIYRGVMPFVAIQVAALAIVAAWPSLATWLPELLRGN